MGARADENKGKRCIEFDQSQSIQIHQSRELEYQQNIPVVRYVLDTERDPENDGKPFNKGVFAFPTHWEIDTIDEQAKAYFDKHLKKGETRVLRRRWYGIMNGWLIKIPAYVVPEMFGNMTYQRSSDFLCNF